MKKFPRAFLCASFCLFITVSGVAQDSSSKTDSTMVVEEEAGPIVFKFEPDFTSENEKRKAKIAETRSIIDTLSISDRRRVKLLRDLYKNGVSRRLEKAILADNHFEDNDE